MKKLTWLCCMAAGVMFAGVIEDTHSRPKLAATVEVASFGDITKKVNLLGQMINNPIVPTLLVTSLQQSLTQTYGKIRGGSPIYIQYYLQTPAFDVAATNNDMTALQELGEQVLVYPSTDGIAKMSLNHPGSVKGDDGTLHLLANESNPDDRWVKFTEDGKYCAFAKSAAMAKQAIADFEKGEAARKAREAKTKKSPLVRVDVTRRGISAVATLQEAMGNLPGAVKTLKNYVAVNVKIDLNDRGLQVDGRLVPGKEAKVPVMAGVALPAGVLDFAPAKSPFFVCGMNRLQCAYNDEAEFRKEMVDMAQVVRTNVVADLKKSFKLNEKHARGLDELADIFADFCRQMPFPDPRDWGALALGFDAGRHPYLVERGELAKAGANHELSMRLIERLVVMLERLWPGKNMVVKTPTGFVLDWGTIIDVAAAESGVKDDEVAKELANAKQTVTEVLGGIKTAFTYKVEGEKVSALVASPTFSLPAEKSNGEARVAAALPETVKQRPGAVMYMSIYDFVREVMLPVMAKFAKKDEAAQYQAMIKGMATAEDNSAIATALWCGKDGSYRALMRITAGEIKNYGAAFNAFTAASMSSSIEDDDDEDK